MKVLRLSNSQPIDLTTLGSNTPLPSDRSHSIYAHSEPRDIDVVPSEYSPMYVMGIIEKMILLEQNLRAEIQSLRRMVQLCSQEIAMVKQGRTNGDGK